MIEHIVLHYTTKDFTEAEALRLRNERAKELHKEGYVVTCRRREVTDSGASYALDAYKKA